MRPAVPWQTWVIYLSAGMVAHKFACNEAKVLEGYPLERVAKLAHPDGLSEPAFTRALGIVWDTAQDTFSFSPVVEPTDELSGQLCEHSCPFMTSWSPRKCY